MTPLVMRLCSAIELGLTGDQAQVHQALEVRRAGNEAHDTIVDLLRKL